MSINRAGLDLVKRFEGLHEVRPDGTVEAYLDPVNIWTIGYGHTGMRHLDGSVYEGRVISEREAESLLAHDLEYFADAVRRLVRVPLNDNQFAALVSFTFNVGEGALGRSTLLRKLNAGDYEGAADEFHKWRKAGGRVMRGLVRRRAAESELFEDPISPPQHDFEADEQRLPPDCPDVAERRPMEPLQPRPKAKPQIPTGGIINGPLAGKRLELSLGAAALTWLGQALADPEKQAAAALLIDRVFIVALVAAGLFTLTRIVRIWKS